MENDLRTKIRKIIRREDEVADGSAEVGEDEDPDAARERILQMEIEKFKQRQVVRDKYEWRRKSVSSSHCHYVEKSKNCGNSDCKTD